MKQLVILSGKGGTGKTSVAAAFAHLTAGGQPAVRAVLADADVDAANLELVLAPQKMETHEFVGGAVAAIDPEKCQGCGTCYDVCRFDAIIAPSPDVGRGGQGGEGMAYAVDPIACDGCAACVYQCPRRRSVWRRNLPATGSAPTAAMGRCSTPRCGPPRRTPASW